jgi:NAD(P)H-dependent FMN reductase
VPVAKWFHEYAVRHGKFETELIDLAEVNLPLVDEPNHPRLKKYQHAHTKAWSATIARGDAYVFVTPEYNYSVPPSLINALDYLYEEWAYKPAAFVSYGGISGGLRSVQMAKLTAITLRMMPIPEGVPVPLFAQAIDKEAGTFKANELHEKSANTMLNELLRWADALKPMRSGA